MKVIPPLAIAGSILTSSTVIETAPAAYNAGTTYGDGATVSVAGSGGLLTVYESLQASNTGNTPASSPLWWVSIGETYQVYSSGATYAIDDRVIDATNHLVYSSVVAGNNNQALTDETKWQLIGPTNKWAMFDLLSNTPSIQPGSLTVVITPGERVDSLAVLNMQASSIEVTVTSSAVEVYSYTEDLNTREVMSWRDYFFAPFSTRPNVVLHDLPPFSNAVITVELTSTTGDVMVTDCIVGTAVDIGQVQAEAESDVLNFSTVTRDFDGGISTMVQRRNVPKTVQNIWLPKAQVNRVRALRDDLNGVPAVWSALDNQNHDYFESVLMKGFYRRFSINLKHADYAVISLELESI